MGQLTAFTYKEFLELARTGKMLILTVLSVLFGIMNPALAKLTPLLMEGISGSPAETGFAYTITAVEVNALTSWTQFYKNGPIALILFFLIFSSILTAERQKGTLISLITKGMKRWKIIISKTAAITVMWTAGCWLCYGITLGYNAYFWDNSIVSHMFFSAFCFYLAGVWLLSLIPLMSALFQSNSSVVLASGGVFLLFYLLGQLSGIRKYLPVQLLASQDLLLGISGPREYLYAAAAAAALTLIDTAAAVICFQKSRI